MGSAEGGHPDLFRFPRFLRICSDLRSLLSGIPRFVPICSVRFALISSDCSDYKSEQIRTDQGNPFLPTPFVNPRHLQESLGHQNVYRRNRKHPKPRPILDCATQSPNPSLTVPSTLLIESGCSCRSRNWAP